MRTDFSFQPKTNKNNENNFYNISDFVKYHMKIKGIKQSDLVKHSGLPKTTISRIYRNSNDKGSTYYTKNVGTLMPLSIALRLTPGERDEMLLVAMPELGYWNEFLEEEYDLSECNEVLYDNGLPLIGNTTE